MSERTWGLGVVIGKFRPPHLGHSLLIRTALEQTQRLVVFVCADASDTLPVELRASWLRELFPAADVRVVETTGYDAADSVLWARLTRDWLGRAPDVVFTSEAYGETWAAALGCVHVAVDPARQQVPIAASRILARPSAHLDYLEPPVRAHFVSRVAIVGAESTGKTTLARALARYYQTVWVPEYGRMLWDGLLTLPELRPTTADFEHIARMQQQMEDQLARHARRLLICDTDAFATWLWHERNLGTDAVEVRAVADGRSYTLYLLTGDEIPWEDDGTRDRADERPWFHARFAEELQRQGKPYVPIHGSPEQRLAQAVVAIDAAC